MDIARRTGIISDLRLEMDLTTLFQSSARADTQNCQILRRIWRSDAFQLDGGIFWNWREIHRRPICALKVADDNEFHPSPGRLSRCSQELAGAIEGGLCVQILRERRDAGDGFAQRADIHRQL